MDIAEADRLRAERAEAGRLMSEYARKLGEMEGRYKAAHWPGIVDDWQEKCASLELRLKQAHEALRQIADGSVPPDQHGHYLAHRECVRIARTVLRQQPQASPGNRKDGEAQS